MLISSLKSVILYGTLVILLFQTNSIVAQDVDFDLKFNIIIGSDGYDYGLALDIDSAGNIIFVSYTLYPIKNTGISGPSSFYQGPYYDSDPEFIEFPLIDPFDSSYNGLGDIVISKITPDGEIFWSSYFGGNKDDRGLDVAVDSEDNMIIVGRTTSDNFKTKNSIQGILRGNLDGYVAKFFENGTLAWSTYFGGSGSDSTNGVLVDKNDNIIITGDTSSDDFPVLNAIDTTYNGTYFTGSNAFISKFTQDGALIWSTYFGGDFRDKGYSLALDKNNNIIIVGLTSSEDFPIINATGSEFNGKSEVFLINLSEDGQLIYSTFLGGFLTDFISDMKLDSEGNILITGYTESNDFPIQQAQDGILNTGPEDGIQKDVFITKLSSNGTVIWSTYVGDSEGEVGNSINIDAQDNILVTGSTDSPNFPIIDSVKPDDSEGIDNIFTLLLNKNGLVLYSSVYGGNSDEKVGDSVIDMAGNLVTIGYTKSTNYPYTFAEYDSLALTNVYISYRFLPEIEIEDVVSNIDDLNSEKSKELANDENERVTDEVTIILLSGIGLFLGYKVLNSLGVSKLFKNEKITREREEISEYFAKIRDSSSDND